jgi:hypothetical protein
MFPIPLVTLTGHMTNEALRQALDTTGTLDKEAADAMRVHKSQVSRWRSNIGEVPDSRARCLPTAARIRYYELLAEDADVFVLPRALLDWLWIRLGFKSHALTASLASAIPADRQATQEVRRYA